jgi:hypothetical protein
MSGTTAGRTRKRIFARDRADPEQRDGSDDREKLSRGNSGCDA